MNHVLDKQNLAGKLYENRNQLRDHIVAAVRDGVKVCAAASMVNITTRDLKKLVSTMKTWSPRPLTLWRLIARYACPWERSMTLSTSGSAA